MVADACANRSLVLVMRGGGKRHLLGEGSRALLGRRLGGGGARLGAIPSGARVVVRMVVDRDRLQRSGKQVGQHPILSYRGG